MTGRPDRGAADPGDGVVRSRRRHRRSHRRRNAILVLLAVVAVLGAGLAIRTTTAYLPALEDARAARTDLDRLLGTARSAGLAMDREDLESMRADLASAGARFDRLDALLRDDPAAGLARLFPASAETLAGTDATMAAAGSLLEAAASGLDLADRFVTIKEEQAASADGGSSLAQLVALMATGTEDVDAMLAALDRADQALATTPATLPGPIGQVRDLMVEKLAEYGPALRGYADADDVLPSMLGWGTPRRYLVLTQNPAELRPTGGYIGSFGTIAFDEGRITERAFQDVFLLDLPWDYPFVEAPDALRRYLLGPDQPWQLADANWSPDFPASARQAIALYENEGGPGEIDGVIAITTQTIDELLSITGPVAVPEYGVTIASGETTLKVLQNTRVAQAEGENRKAFLAAFAERLFGTLLSMPPAKWLELGDRVPALRDGRLVQAWLEDADAQAEVVAMGFDGAVRQDSGDYVYPVDSNVAPTSKLNAVTDRELALDVRIDEYGNAVNELAVAWTNTIESDEARPYREIETLEDADTLGLYFRLLVPLRSRLETVVAGATSPIADAETVGEEAGRSYFANYFRIPPGSARLRYRWVSPYPAEEGDDGVVTYRLTIQKQPGARPGPLALRITLPPGSTVIDASPGLTRAGDVLQADTQFDRDLVAVVRYRPAPEVP